MNDGQKKAAIATSIIVSALFFTLTTLQGNKTQREIRQLQKEIKGGGTSGITG